MELTAPPRRILVLCTHNSVRSPMAAAMLGLALGPDVRVRSAGLDPHEIDPFVVSLMAQAGVDLSRHEPCAFDAGQESECDLVITLSKSAWIAARTFSARTGVPVEYWQVSDPPSILSGGSRDQILQEYRAIQTELAQHIRNRFDVQVGKPVPEMV